MNARALARLANLLRGGRSNARHREETFRQRLDKARSAVLRWKRRASDAAARRQELRERLTAAVQALRETRRRLAAARRELPTPAVVQDVFLHRVRTLPARVNARSLAPDGAGGRGDPAFSGEAQLIRVSAPYRGALERGPDALSGIARRIDLDGLAWWIPAETGTQPAGRSPETPRFPFRGILQTRDVASGGIMLDLGANVGRMAIPRVILGDVSIAYCAEPDPVTFACLARNVIDNGLRGLVLPDQTAIGDREGTVRLLRAGSSGNFRVLRNSPARRVGPPERRTDQPALVGRVAERPDRGEGGMAASEDVVDVPCCTLDAWVQQLHIDLDAVTFIKVDVEGFERRLVAGAGGVLSRPHIAWQMEIKPSGLRAAGDEPEDLYADLQRVFTHFIDLNRRAVGARVRPIADLRDAMRYIEPDRKTDVLLLSTAGRLA